MFEGDEMIQSIQIEVVALVLRLMFDLREMGVWDDLHWLCQLGALQIFGPKRLNTGDEMIIIWAELI